jgi:hypothetical protein
MSRGARRLTRRVLTLCLLLVSMAVAMSRAEERAAGAWCPVCPIPYSCDPWTGDCVCDCPDIFGNCPASCA